MRSHLCIGMILRSDESVAPARTLKSLMSIATVLQGLGGEWSFIPVQGMPHAAARNRLLSQFLAHGASDCEDLLWLDFGNSLAGDAGIDVAEICLRAMLTSEADVVCFPSPLRNDQEHPYPFNCFPPKGKPRLYQERLLGIPGVESWELQELESCGFGMVRMMRSAAAKVHAYTRESESRPNYPNADGSVYPGANCFGHLVEGDQELGEDVSFCRRARRAGVKLWAAVDLECAHGSQLPGVNFPRYRETMNLGRFEAAPPVTILGPNGRAAVH